MAGRLAKKVVEGRLSFVTVGAIGSLAIALLAVTAIAAPPPRGNSKVKFTAEIVSLPGGGLVGDWTVGEYLVHVTPTTRIDDKRGPAVVGATVDVDRMGVLGIITSGTSVSAVSGIVVSTTDVA